MQFYLLTVQDTYIRSVTDFIAINGKNDNFILAADLDFTSVTDYQPITFSGTFDGRGYTISNINIKKALYTSEIHHLGVFAALCSVTMIKNLRLNKIMVDFTKTNILYTDQLNAAILVSSYQGNVLNVSIIDSSIKLNANANVVLVGTLIAQLTSGTIKVKNVTVNNQIIEVANLQTLNPYAIQIGGLIGLSSAILTVQLSYVKYGAEVASFNIVNIGGIVGKTQNQLTIQQTSTNSTKIYAPFAKKLNYAAFIANADSKVVFITDIKSYINCSIAELISDICGIHCDKLTVVNSLAVYQGKNCILKKSNIWQDEKDHTVDCTNCYVISDKLTKDNAISQEMYDPADSELSDQENWEKNDSSNQHELVIPDNKDDSPDYGTIVPPVDTCKKQDDVCAPNATCELVDIGSIHYFQCLCKNQLVTINNKCTQTGCLVDNIICGQNYDLCINGTCQIPDPKPNNPGEENKKDTGLNIGLIIGCVIGALLLILLIILLIYFLHCKNKKKPNQLQTKNTTTSIALKQTTEGTSQKTKSTTPPKPLASPQQVRQIKTTPNDVKVIKKRAHIKPIIEKSKIIPEEIIQTQLPIQEEENQESNKKMSFNLKVKPKVLDQSNSSNIIKMEKKLESTTNVGQHGGLKPIRKNKGIKLKKIIQGDPEIVV